MRNAVLLQFREEIIVKESFCTIVLVFLLLAASSACGQPVELDPMIVTATRTPRHASEVISSVTVITADQIAASGAMDLGQVLKNSVGVEVIDSGPMGSKTSLSIRGSEAGQVLVLLNGIRMNSPQLGQFDLSDLPVSLKEIDHIEILRGPASAIYGPNALGGVVQIFTKNAEREPLTRLSWREGRYDTRLMSFSTSGKKGPVSYRLGAGRDHSNGFRANSGLVANTLDGTVGLNLPGGFDLSLSAFQLDKDLEVPGSVDYPTPNARQKDSQTRVSLTLSGPAGPVQLLLRPVYSRLLNRYKDPNGWPPQDDRHLVETLGTELQGSMKAGTHSLVFGGEFYRDDLDSSANGQVDQERWSVFGQDEIEVGNRLTFLLGLRYDAHSDFRNELSPRIGARFRIDDATRLRLSAGRAYRAPTLNDRFWPDTGYVRGNPDLDPETAWEYELALDRTLGSLGRLTLAGFDREVKDLIAWAPDATGVWEPENLTRARIWGTEAQMSFRLCSLLGAGANYTYLHPKDRDTGAFIVGKYRHKVDAYLELGPWLDTSLHLDGRYLDYYPDPARTSQSYVVFDATLTRPFLLPHGVEVELTLSVKNLFDRNYEETPGFPMPPINWMAGATAYF